MSKPALVTVGILTFISSWNSFLWPLLVTNEKKYRLLNNGLAAFTTESGSDFFTDPKQFQRVDPSQGVDEMIGQ